MRWRESDCCELFQNGSAKRGSYYNNINHQCSNNQRTKQKSYSAVLMRNSRKRIILIINYIILNNYLNTMWYHNLSNCHNLFPLAYSVEKETKTQTQSDTGRVRRDRMWTDLNSDWVNCSSDFKAAFLEHHDWSVVNAGSYERKWRPIKRHCLYNC